MKKLTTSFENSKKLKNILNNNETLFSWFGDEKHYNDGGVWIWCDSTEPKNNQERDHRANINQQNPICPAYTVLEMMPYFEKGKNGEYLNDAIQRKLNSSNKLSSFLADPNFYAALIIEIEKKEYVIEDDGGVLIVRHNGIRCLIWELGNEKVGHRVSGIYSEHTNMVTIIENHTLPVPQKINILGKKTYS